MTFLSKMSRFTYEGLAKIISELWIERNIWIVINTIIEVFILEVKNAIVQLLVI